MIIVTTVKLYFIHINCFYRCHFIRKPVQSKVLILLTLLQDDVFATVRRSPYGSNIHRPEFDRSKTPGEIHVSETQPPGTKLMKVGQFESPAKLSLEIMLEG